MSEKELTPNAFYITNENTWENVDEGISRQITNYNNDLMMVKVKFEKGAIGYKHHHIHSQASYVAAGKFEVTIDNETKVLEAGDTFFANPNLVHGVVCLEAGVLIDIFNPVREDFI
ncbi:cupin domain-containing protein [Joostella sp. CR20]|uniref:cupin domain-containing protein n=1 Tax=Joostella sp. CR20 TaxID=2804312 RepID=UPI00313B0E93